MASCTQHQIKSVGRRLVSTASRSSKLHQYLKPSPISKTVDGGSVSHIVALFQKTLSRLFSFITSLLIKQPILKTCGSDYYIVFPKTISKSSSQPGKSFSHKISKNYPSFGDWLNLSRLYQPGSITTCAWRHLVLNFDVWGYVRGIFNLFLFREMDVEKPWVEF